MRSNNEKNAEPFYLNIDQAKKINALMPKGYKVISVDDFKKRLNQSKKKSKILYQPTAEILAPPQPRRAKQEKYYYEGEGEDEPNNRTVHYEFEKSQEEPWRKRQVEKPPKQKTVYVEPPVKPKSVAAPTPQVVQLLPTIQPIDAKIPLTPRQIIEELEKHSKFRIIQIYSQQYPEKCNYNNILIKINQSTYGLQDIMQDLQKLFICLYSDYPRSSEMYASATELEGYLNNLIDVQKNKTQDKKPEKATVKIDYNISPIIQIQQQLLTPELSRQPTQNKKRTLPIKPDIKSITIMDKRQLGQNIKKLSSDELSDICRIVFDTLETREQYIIDIDTLPLKKIKQLQIYVNTCIQKNGGLVFDNQDKNEEDSSESSFVITDDDN